MCHKAMIHPLFRFTRDFLHQTNKIAPCTYGTPLYYIYKRNLARSDTQNLYRILPEAISDKKLFQIKQKEFPVFPDKKLRFSPDNSANYQA